MAYRIATHPVTGERAKAYASDELDAALAHSIINCGHDREEWRRVEIANGTTPIYKICLDCGIKRSEAQSKVNFLELPKIVDAASIRKENQLLEDIKRFDIIKSFQNLEQQTQKQFAKEYGLYLKSNVWKKKREKVLVRANYVCEGCGINEANEVHHLTYEHRFMEFLFELVALCPECHSIIHFDKNGNIRSSPIRNDEGIRCEGCRWSGEEGYQRWCLVHDAPAQASLRSENLCNDGRNGYEGLK